MRPTDEPLSPLDPDVRSGLISLEPFRYPIVSPPVTRWHCVGTALRISLTIDNCPDRRTSTRRPRYVFVFSCAASCAICCRMDLSPRPTTDPSADHLQHPAFLRKLPLGHWRPGHLRLVSATRQVIIPAMLSVVLSRPRSASLISSPIPSPLFPPRPLRRAPQARSPD